jgi:hypothetical protein
MPTLTGGLVAEGAIARGGTTNVRSITASTTLTEADNGGIVLANAVDLVVTLPPTRLGYTVTIITQTASASTGVSISPDAADKIQGKGITAADDKDWINTAATDAVGDLVTLVGDGVDGWWVVSERGTWARQA